MPLKLDSSASSLGKRNESSETISLLDGMYDEVSGRILCVMHRDVTRQIRSFDHVVKHSPNPQ